jgi:two-component system, LuxR family, response regulator FixJ
MDTTTPWVAIVDDDHAIRQALLRLLDASGIAAAEFAGGAELLNNMAPFPPCCVLLDLNMPGMTGHQVQARLAILAPRTHVIAMTGQHTPDIEARVLRYRNTSYLRKPMSEQALLDAIGRARSDWQSSPHFLAPLQARP